MQQQPTTSEGLSIDGIRHPGRSPRPGRRRQDRHRKTLARSRDLLAQSFLKVGLVTCLSLLLLVGISSVGGTMSYYLDIETSLNNLFKADPLDFTVTVATSTQIDMSGGDQMMVPVFTPGLDSEPIQYFVTTKVTAGDSVFCNSIQLLATAPFVYDGLLLSLSTGTTTEIGPWALTFGRAADATSTPASCHVDLIYKGWNANAMPGKGYTDVEKLSLTFFIPDSTTTPLVLGVSTSSPPSEPVASSTPPTQDASSTPTSTTTPSDALTGAGGGGSTGSSEGGGGSGGGGGGGGTDTTPTPPASSDATSSPDTGQSTASSTLTTQDASTTAQSATSTPDTQTNTAAIVSTDSTTTPPTTDTSNSASSTPSSSSGSSPSGDVSSSTPPTTDTSPPNPSPSDTSTATNTGPSP